MSVASGRARLRRLLAHSRPRFWLYLAGPVLVGLAFAAPTLASFTSPLAVALVAYFLVPANVFLYGINDVFDADVDRENPKKDDREVRDVGSTTLRGAVAASALLGVGLVVVAPAPARPWLVGFLVLGAAYSAPPIRFKTRPVLDSLSNGLYVVPGAAAYAALAGTAPPMLALLGGWAWTAAMHALSAIPDREPDARAGIETIATRLGREGTLAFCLLAWLLAAVAFGLLDVRAGVLLGIYPVLAAVWLARNVAVRRVYWYYPAINAAVGAVLTLAGLWGIVRA